MDDSERLAFIRGHTSPAPVPLVPEIVVYQAAELAPIWRAAGVERGRDPGPAPFWAFPWAGGQALARYVLDHPAVVSGRAVFDFATGSGLVAIAAARAGAERVTACDLSPYCRQVVRLNAELNGVQVAFRDTDPIGDPLDGFEVVLAGDVFYERELADRALPWLALIVARGGVALVGDPGRLYSPRSGLVERSAYEVPTSKELESASPLSTWVYEVEAARS